MTLVIWLACQPPPLLALEGIVHPDKERLSKDANFRAIVVAWASDPVSRDSKYLASALAQDECILSRCPSRPPDEDIVPAVLIAWQKWTLEGQGDASAYDYINSLCDCRVAMGKTPPPVCSLPDPRWVTCPSVRPNPVLCGDRNSEPFAPLSLAPATVTP
jgi:hypothetical protein